MQEDRTINLDTHTRGYSTLEHNAFVLIYSNVDTTKAEAFFQETFMSEILFCIESGPLRPPFVPTSSYLLIKYHFRAGKKD